MKINPISFGTTYLKPSVQYMNPENRKKLESVFGLGEIYPVDLYLGANRMGDLTLEIKRASIYEYLLNNNHIKLTPENVAALNIIKDAENADLYIHGNRSPVKKLTIKDIDYIPEDILKYYIADEIEAFNNEHAKNSAN